MQHKIKCPWDVLPFDLHVEGERLSRLRVDHPAAWRQDAARRREKEFGDAVDEEEADQHANRDGQQGMDDALPELVEMLQKRHLPAGSVFFVRRQGACG